MINFGWISTRMAVLRTKKELPVLEHRSHGRMPLISHPYNNSSAVYLGTTIVCFRTHMNTTLIWALCTHPVILTLLNYSLELFLIVRFKDIEFILIHLMTSSSLEEAST